MPTPDGRLRPRRSRRLPALAAALALALTQSAALAQQPFLSMTEETAFLVVDEPETAAVWSGEEDSFATYPSVTLRELILDDEGFAVNGEYVYYNEENGEYRYLSPTLNIHIVRHEDTSPRVVWHEAQIYARDGTLFRMYPYDEDNWMKKSAHQTVIAQKNHLVFAVNGDFSHLRIGWKATVGLLIRNGLVISERTFTKKATRYPNLDNLALLPDGSMLAMGRNELTIEDYVAMGAYDLLAFGPVLIHDGEPNTSVFSKYGWERAPRTAVGMVTPGHYVVIMVEGRHEDSRGWSVTHMAEHMAELGVTEALNLDGGQSATMIFMGKQIIRVGKSESLTAKPRKSAEVLGIGRSPLVQLPEE